MMAARYDPFETLEARQQFIITELAKIKQMLTSKPPIDTRFYSVKEAAEKLKCSEITLYRHTKSGKAPSKRIGSRVMIPASYVDR